MKYNYDKNAFLYINNKLDYSLKNFLERDDDFMRAVVKMSKSPEIFEKCSSKLKNDGDFIEELVEVFKDNPKFLSEMVSSYIANNKGELQTIRELNILLSNLYDETFAKELEKFSADAYDFYLSSLDDIELELSNLDANARLDAGEGFIFVDASFHSSDIVKHFFAERMIEDIFESRTIYNFEQLVHCSVSSLAFLKQNGERAFLMNFIGTYDVTLMDYVMNKQDLLDKYVVMMKEIEENWDSYCKEVNTHNIDCVYTEMEEYIKDNGLSYNLVDLFDGIVKLSDNRDKISKYVDIDEKAKIDYKKIDIPTIKFVRHMKEFLDEVFEYDVAFCNNQDSKNDIMDNDNIIKVDFRKKKVKK